MSKDSKEKGEIRSMNIPGDVRDALRAEAKTRGVSMSALTRGIMEEYIDGKLLVPEPVGPKIVSTSMWVPSTLWAKFTRKTERDGHSSQWIFRTWLDREHSSAA
jgi:hypothetical protein